MVIASFPKSLRLKSQIIGAVGLALSLRTYAAPPAEDVFAEASRSVVTVLAFDREQQPKGLGSGVVIAPERVVTNCHVLTGADAVGVVFSDQGLEAQVIDSMITRDLCLLSVQGLAATPIKFGRAEDLRVGQRVYSLGAPHGLELTFSEGMISSLRSDGDAQLIQTSAPISHGSSGGALLSNQGLLIGITTLQHATGQNLNFAVPADWIWRFRTLQ